MSGLSLTRYGCRRSDFAPVARGDRQDEAQARVSAGRSLMGTKGEDGKVSVKDVIQVSWCGSRGPRAEGARLM